jgi:hypothetical protein
MRQRVITANQFISLEYLVRHPRRHSMAAHDFQWMKVSSMRIAMFLKSLGLGVTENAGCRWAWGRLRKRGHQVTGLTLKGGRRRTEIQIELSRLCGRGSLLLN